MPFKLHDAAIKCNKIRSHDHNNDIRRQNDTKGIVFPDIAYCIQLYFSKRYHKKIFELRKKWSWPGESYEAIECMKYLSPINTDDCVTAQQAFKRRMPFCVGHARRNDPFHI